MSKKYYIVFLLPLVYVLTFFVAKSPGSNFDYLLGWLGYVGFFVMLLWVKNQKVTEKWISHLFGLSGIVISFFSLFGVWGWTNYRDIMLDNRLTGPFQYANTFAAVIGAFWIYSLIMLSKKRQSWLETIIFSFPLIAYGVGFFHSYSRGAFVVLPIVWLIGLIALKSRDQLQYVATTIVSMISSLIIFRIMIVKEELGATNPGLFAVVFGTIAMVAYALVVFMLNRIGTFARLDETLSAKGWLRMVVPVLSFVAGLLLFLDIQNEGAVYRLLPTTLQERVGQIDLETTSALARTDMYRDAWKISKEFPLLGLGGDGWKVMYSRYQSAPYLSNEIHNGYLDILVSTGWIGFIIFVTVFGYLIYQILLNYRRKLDQEDYQTIVAVMAALMFVFAHSFIDFNFSYGYTWLFVFWLMAMGLPGIPQNVFRLKISPIPVRFEKWVSRTILILIIAGISTGFIFSYRFYAAEQEIVKIVQPGGSIDLNQGLRGFTRATDKNPYSTRLWIGLANMYAHLYNRSGDQEAYNQAKYALDQAERLESDNPATLWDVAKVYNLLSEPMVAADFLEKAIQFDPFNVLYYENLLVTYRDALVKSDKNQQLKIAEKMISYYEQYSEWYKQWKGVPVPDRKPLELDHSAHSAVILGYNIAKQYARGLEVFHSLGFVIHPSLHEEETNFLDVPYQLNNIMDYISKYQHYLVVLSVKDEASSKLSSESEHFLSLMGSKIGQLEYRDSYIGVISRGQFVYEKIDKERIELDAEHVPELRNVFNDREVRLISAGFESGNRSSILVDGIEYSLNRRGINIAVFDDEMHLIDQITFDTFLSDKMIVPVQ